MCRSHGRWLELLHAGPQNTSATKVSYRAHAGKYFSVDIHKLQPHSHSVAGYEVPCAASRPATSYSDRPRRCSPWWRIRRMIFQSILISCSRTRPSWLATRFLMRIVAAAILIASWLPGPAFGLTGTTGHQATEFTIYKPDTNEVMGHAKYSVKTEGEYEMVTGEYRYVTGSYDIEHDKLAVSPTARMPALIKYDHTFYRPDGSSDHATTADLQSGVASCMWSSDGNANTETKTLNFPSDTYAGGSVILALQSYLADGHD